MDKDNELKNIQALDRLASGMFSEFGFATCTPKQQEQLLEMLINKDQ